MRRLRAWFAATRSGSPGTRSGGTTTPPRGARWTRDWRKCLVPGNADPGARNRRVWRAERRHVPETARAQRHWPRRLARHLPHFRGRRKGTTAYPGPQRIRAAERWLFTGNRRRELRERYDLKCLLSFRLCAW